MAVFTDGKGKRWPPSLKKAFFADGEYKRGPSSLKMAVFADESGFTGREGEDLVYLGLGFIKYAGELGV